MQQINQMDTDEIVDTSEPVSRPSGSRHGNINILLQSPIHLSLGPDYKNCIGGFLFLCIAGVALLVFVHFQIDNKGLTSLGIVLLAMSIFFYLMTALSNPGIYSAESSTQPKPKFCYHCQHFHPNSVRHCLKCRVCIEGYDHHCPWMSKCVGKKNIVSFYIFVLVVTVMNGYMYYSFYQAFSIK